VLSITAICDFYSWLYSPLPTPPGTWDHLLPVDGAYAAIKRIDGVDYVMLRGSETAIDWVLDFLNFAVPYNDPEIGDIHPGARFGVNEIRPIIDDLVGDHVVFVGHSLGAMHAAQLAAYRVANGKPVDGLVMFGEPKPGGQKLADILAHVPVQSFRNAHQYGHDAVTDVCPFPPYRHVREPLTDCWRSPKPFDLWGNFSWHHFRLYAESFGAAGPAVLSLPSPGVGAP
jgi:pimeloyl-ACP methyl ester carboxylesterase